MTRDELVENVARAICKQQGLDPDFNYDPNGIGGSDRLELRWKLFIGQATAALSVIYEALKEPSEEMLSDCLREGWVGSKYTGKFAWRSILDASPLSYKGAER